MADFIPILKSLFQQFLTNYESKINQTSPLADVAFLKVIASEEAAVATGIYKLITEAVLQNLALTATGDDLDKILPRLPRKPAEAFRATITIPAEDGTIFPVSRGYIGDSNSIRYAADAEVVASGGLATINVQAEIEGDSQSLGNLDVGDTMSIEAPLAGASTTATITVILNIGADKETDESYRPRVLAGLRIQAGGGNIAQYREWAEKVSGVFRAYPISGRPAYAGTPVPGDRTLYIECDFSIDPDGIPPSPLIDEVRDALNFDPETGKSRAPLGLEDQNLWVEPIIRTALYVEIRNLQVSPALESELKTTMDEAVDAYFRTVRPYIEGADSIVDKNNLVTDNSLSFEIEDVLRSFSATADGKGFGDVPGSFLVSYIVQENETLKLGGTITYT